MEPWDAQEMARGGIGAVLSINHGELVDAEALASAGIEHLCVPLSTSAPPEPGDLEICVDALPRAFEFAEQSIASGQTVLAHCRAGKDRTGMFLCYDLCRSEGLSAEQAIEEVRRVRSIALTAEGYVPFTLEVLAALGV